MVIPQHRDGLLHQGAVSFQNLPGQGIGRSHVLRPGGQHRPGQRRAEAAEFVAPKRLYLLPCSIGIWVASGLLDALQQCRFRRDAFGDRSVELCKLKIAFKVVPQWERVGFEPGVQSGGNELVDLLGQCRCINTGLCKE